MPALPKAVCLSADGPNITCRQLSQKFISYDTHRMMPVMTMSDGWFAKNLDYNRWTMTRVLHTPKEGYVQLSNHGHFDHSWIYFRLRSVPNRCHFDNSWTYFLCFRMFPNRGNSPHLNVFVLQALLVKVDLYSTKINYPSFGVIRIPSVNKASRNSSTLIRISQLTNHLLSSQIFMIVGIPPMII